MGNKNHPEIRNIKVKVKTAKGRKISSTRWLERQLNDPFVQAAKKRGYRSRSAFKIIEIDDKYKFLKPGARVLDLGCAPGGWSQIAARRTNSDGHNENKKKGFVLGLDLKEVLPINGVIVALLNFIEADSKQIIWDIIEKKVDVVMSDMAPDASGHKKTDHLRIINLCEEAAYFAFDVLNKGGIFIAKVLEGGAETTLQKVLKQNFKKVATVKPKSSRKDSSEKFVIAIGFRV